MSKDKNTVQLGLRVEKALLKKIESYSKYEGIDKMSFIRRAITLFINQVEESISNQTIESYIHLRSNDETLKKLAKFDKIPKDIIDARKENLRLLQKNR